MQHRPSRRVSVPALIVFCLLALALVVLVAVRAVSVNNTESAETLAPAASETPVPPDLRSRAHARTVGCAHRGAYRDARAHAGAEP